MKYGGGKGINVAAASSQSRNNGKAVALGCIVNLAQAKPWQESETAKL